jgi:geranylgeranyl reductase family protein
MIKAPDVIVVGAGPSGLLAAGAASSKGAKVLVLEEHDEIGKPIKCSGIISSSGLKQLDISPKPSFILNKVRGARFNSPGGEHFLVEGKLAYVIDREKFDKYLAEVAIRSGTTIRTSCRVESLMLKGRNIIGVRTSKGEQIESKVVIDGEGISSKLLQNVNLITPNKTGIIPAIQFEIADINRELNFVDLYFSKKLTPGFFAWIIPITKNISRIGLASNKGDLVKKINVFLGSISKTYSIIRVNYGSVYTSLPSSRTSYMGLLVVGDAAGQVKATTGGGVIIGGICAKIAGSIAAEISKTDNPSLEKFQMYDTLWKSKLSRELWIMAMSRKVANLTEDKTIDKIFKIVIENDMIKEIEREGDIDYQSRVLTMLFMKPDLYKMLMFVASDIVSEILSGKPS